MMMRMLGLRCCCCCWAVAGALATKIARNDPITLAHSFLLTFMMHSNTVVRTIAAMCPRFARGCTLAVSLWGREAAGELALGPISHRTEPVHAFDVRQCVTNPASARGTYRFGGTAINS